MAAADHLTLHRAHECGGGGGGGDGLDQSRRVLGGLRGCKCSDRPKAIGGSVIVVDATGRGQMAYISAYLPPAWLPCLLPVASLADSVYIPSRMDKCIHEC